MNKGLKIYFGILALAVLIFIIPFVMFFCAIFVPRAEITKEDFINKAESLGLKISKLQVNVTSDDKNLDSDMAQNFLNNNINESYAGQSEDAYIKYIKFSNKNIAYKFLLSEYDNEVEAKRKTSKNANNEYVGKTSYNPNNANIIKAETNFGYFAFIRVNKTYIEIFAKDSATLEKILDTLNYNTPKIGFGIIILYTWFTIVFWLIFATIPLAYIFKKTNRHPVLAFVPIVRLYFLCEIADKEGWKMVFLLLPVVNIVYQIILSLKLAKVFGKSELFGIGIYFLPIIFNPIIAFDDSKYIEGDDGKKEISVDKFIATMKSLDYKIEDLSDNIRISGITYIMQASSQDNLVIAKYTQFINEDLARNYSLTLEKSNQNGICNNILCFGNSVIHATANLENKDEINKIFDELSKTEE